MSLLKHVSQFFDLILMIVTHKWIPITNNFKSNSIESHNNLISFDNFHFVKWHTKAPTVQIQQSFAKIVTYISAVRRWCPWTVHTLFSLPRCSKFMIIYCVAKSIQQFIWFSISGFFLGGNESIVLKIVANYYWFDHYKIWLKLNFIIFYGHQMCDWTKWILELVYW